MNDVWLAISTVMLGFVVGAMIVIVALGKRYTRRRAVLYWFGFAVMFGPYFGIKAYLIATGKIP